MVVLSSIHIQGDAQEEDAVIGYDIRYMAYLIGRYSRKYGDSFEA